MNNKDHIPAVQKYIRGSIWWCRDEGLKVCEEGKQHGTRPALIISSNERGSNPTVEVLKMTTQDRSNRCPGINIPVFMNGQPNYILCNQHFTVSLNSLSEFLGICPEEVMVEVEKGMLRACGMSHLIEMQNKYFDLTRTVEQVVDSRLNKYRVPTPDNSSTVVDVISGVINGLNNMLNTAEESLKSQMIEEAKINGDSIIVKKETSENVVPTKKYIPTIDEVDKIVTSTLSNNETTKNTTRTGFKNYKPYKPEEADQGIEPSYKNTEKSKAISPKEDLWENVEISGIEVQRSKNSGKISWTLEAVKKFLKDCETYPLSQVREIWSMSNNKSVSQMKYLLRNKYNL